MSTTTLPDEPRPVRVTLTFDVGGYVEAIEAAERRAEIAAAHGDPIEDLEEFGDGDA